MKNQNRVMFALVNYKQQVIAAPDGNFYQGLPDSGATYFCFASHDDAKSAAQNYVSPKFEVLPVAIDANGFPSKTITIERINEMADQIVDYWQTAKGKKARRTEPEPFRAAVDHLFPGWEEKHGNDVVSFSFSFNMWDNDAYGCLICATEDHPNY